MALAPFADSSQAGKHQCTAEVAQLRPNDAVHKRQAPVPGFPQPAD